VAWITTTIPFTAASSLTTIRFSDTTGAVDPGTGAGTNWALDAVTVSAPTFSGVPEPSSFAMLALMSAVAGLRIRRRGTR
jgi:hypothetical protein